MCDGDWVTSVMWMNKVVGGTIMWVRTLAAESYQGYSMVIDWPYDDDAFMRSIAMLFCYCYDSNCYFKLLIYFIRSSLSKAYDF